MLIDANDANKICYIILYNYSRHSYVIHVLASL